MTFETFEEVAADWASEWCHPTSHVACRSYYYASGPAAMSQASAIAEGRAVVARNFPAAWVAPAARAGLPQKVCGVLDLKPLTWK